MSRPRPDRGAVAVEFALVLPLLLVLTLGVIAFGNAFHVQTVLDNAARDAVRIYTLTPDAAPALADDAAIASAELSVALTAADVIVTPTPCAEGQNARVTVEHTFEMLGGFFGSITLTGSGTMRCAG